MSPRGASSAASSGASTRNATTPYSRRPASQPKSTRQQFSACGACRMRRVRCDLKDLVIATAGPNPSCSNCKERNIKCVDEFADVKAVKLLRRGRRLQQVEAIYGKTSDMQASTASTTPPTTRLPSIIPNLRPEFFASAFWLWFCIQRPILDPDEFPSRFYAHTKGTQSLGHEGGLIAMLLVVWAASFGLDERGLPPENHPGADKVAPNTKDENDSTDPRKLKDVPHDLKWRERKEKTDAMLREVLELIDFHGVMRRPTLDGVRALLLILPLLEDAQPLERNAIHEATLSQVLALCISVDSPSDQPHLTSEHSDALIRARIFWYAHTQEGLTTGMKGGRFVLTNDDLDTFQRLIPSFASSYAGGGAVSNLGSQHLLHQQYHERSQLSLAKSVEELSQMSRIPLRINTICRRVHEVLTGVKAAKCAEEHGLIEANGMREIWRDLDRCWRELDVLKESILQAEDPTRRGYIEQYACGWQIFIFECHNLIRESLKQYMSITPTQQMYSTSHSPPRPSSTSSTSSPYLPPQQLYTMASRKCFARLPHVVDILKRHLSSGTVEDLALFRWDAGLIRDGCFFAAYLAATIDSDVLDIATDDSDVKESGIGPIPIRYTTEESVAICMAAFARMRWVCSNNEERQQTIKMVWDNRKGRRHHQSHRSEPDIHYRHPPLYEQQPMDPINTQPNGLQPDRPSLPPLSMFANQRRIESAPSTSYTTDGAGTNGWPCYTPPGTATSGTTSTGTGLSARGSPVFPNLTPYKSEVDDPYYHNSSGDIDQFSFNVPIVGPVVREPPMYTQRNLPPDPHSMSSSSSSAYLGQAYTTVSPLVVGPADRDFDGCPQFGENCSGTYH
ncbi:hypothetical protein P691DRAFT_720161 [Macrolepiota fuliginosa MF-IS2]|uniref:Zn(2)-C6 fungal-type domain-containing protein n=1 Tax=Macrolepiota fuliginosa MF-IS2 TaxID=1400762 RepID=A0A9P5XQ92_9AGAR|nr:hypothetical protein P691DRAFT_720161 [Macrolepiota fuliginosa MF-IS2]